MGKGGTAGFSLVFGHLFKFSIFLPLSSPLPGLWPLYLHPLASPVLSGLHASPVLCDTGIKSCSLFGPWDS